MPQRLPVLPRPPLTPSGAAPSQKYVVLTTPPSQRPGLGATQQAPRMIATATTTAAAATTTLVVVTVHSATDTTTTPSSDHVTL